MLRVSRVAYGSDFNARAATPRLREPDRQIADYREPH